MVGWLPGQREQWGENGPSDRGDQEPTGPVALGGEGTKFYKDNLGG